MANPTPPSLSFMPAFELDIQTQFLASNNLISKIECLQRRHILLAIDSTPLPHPPRSSDWILRTKTFYRLNDRGKLEFKHPKKDRDWRKVIPATEVFQVVSNVHFNAVIHAGQDKTFKYVSDHFKGIPREAVRDVLAGCQACAKR